MTTETTDQDIQTLRDALQWVGVETDKADYLYENAHVALRRIEGKIFHGFLTSPSGNE